MKFLKRIFCFLLVVPFAFALVACGKNKDDVPAQETGGSGDSEQEVVIDTSYILNKAFVDFDAHTKTEVDETVCFSAKTENGYVYSEYDEFVYLGMSVLKALSEIELVEGKWCYGNEVVLEGESGYANKVSKFYILSEDIQNFTKITIYMMLEVEGFSGAKYVKTYDMYAYELKYYPVIDEVSVEAMIEKSRNSSSVSTNSTADYFVFSYNNGEILANTFSRIYEFDDLENFTSFNPRIISKYTSLKFDATSNEVLNKIDKFGATDNAGGVDSLTNIQKDIQKKVKRFVSLYEEINDEENKAETKIDKLTGKIVKIANAKHISDFVEN